MFTAKGEIHYGLAPRLRQKPTHPCFAAILTGYPYETVPNKPMLRGKTYGGRDEAEAATLNTDAPQPATLGAPVCPSGDARTLWLRHRALISQSRSLPTIAVHDLSSERCERKEFVAANSNKSMLILIAGPYRSGTNDDPALMRKNIQDMESYALPIFCAGHTPIIGEWLALPLVDLAGSRKVGDEAFNEIFHPIAIRLLEKCDAVLRVGGPSTGADEMVRVGRSLGLRIYTALAEIPQVDSPR